LKLLSSLGEKRSRSKAWSGGFENGLELSEELKEI
jgi:hypothetical protein